MNRLIGLAAGHGGSDPGAVGQGTTEAAQVIDIVNRLADKLRADGQLQVVVVPHELNLVDEINWVNAHYQNLEDGYFLEVHKNSGAGGHGVEVWYFSGDGQSQAYAQQVLNGLVSVSQLPNRGVKGDATNRYGRLGWIRDTNPWAGLAECGFITDGGDTLDNNLWADALKIGVLNLWGLAPLAPAPVVVPPVTPEIRFRVFSGDKQIGAYNQEPNAWNKYAAEGGTKIVDSNGADITAQMVAKYRVTPPEPPVVVTEPPVPAPVIIPVEDPHPVTDPDISSFKLQVREIAAKLELLWKFILSWFNKGK